MALPANANTGTVTGVFIDSAGNPVSDLLRFTPSTTKILDQTATPPTTILPNTVLVSLDQTGSFSTTLLSNEDPDLQPNGWTWNVSSANERFESFDFSLPVGGTVDLATVAPMAPANGAIVVAGLPEGGTTGQMLVKASGVDYDTEWANQPSGTGGGSATLAGLDDVDTTGVVAGEVLKYDGTQWAPAADEAGTGGDAVDSVNGQTGAVVLDSGDVGALPDTYVPPAQSWSEVTGKPTFASVATSGQYGDLAGRPSIPSTAADVGAVPTSRKVNGKALTADVSLAAGDVGAVPGEVGAPVGRFRGFRTTDPTPLVSGDWWFIIDGA